MRFVGPICGLGGLGSAGALDWWAALQVQMQVGRRAEGPGQVEGCMSPREDGGGWLIGMRDVCEPRGEGWGWRKLCLALSSYIG